jgi:HlyD family secretion protein
MSDAAPSLKDQIFRRVALERLSSPEQLDQLVPAMPFHLWLVLGPLVAIALGALIWGWFGSIPSTVTGQALLVNRAGLSDATAKGTGRVTGLTVKSGDMVKAGQVLAHVLQPELADRIEKGEERLAELRALESSQEPVRKESQSLAAAAADQQRSALLHQIEVATENIKIMRDRLATQTQLLHDGLVTEREVLTTRSEMVSSEINVESLKSQLRQLELTRLDRSRGAKGESIHGAAQITEMERAQDSLIKLRDESSTVAAPVDGRVVEVRSENGALVGQGQPVAIIERTVAAANSPNNAAQPAAPLMLSVLAYIPAGQGKRVFPGMEARVVLASVKREEYGYLEGKVLGVSPYPVTPASMEVTLHNESLVRAMEAGGVAVEVQIALEAAETVSGYKWSTQSGPPNDLATGTPATVEIVVQRQRPMELVLPFLRKILGGA